MAASAAPKIAELLSRPTNGKREDVVRVRIDDAREGVEVPAAAIGVLLDALGEMAGGRAVQVMALDQEIGTQAVADILNVSRPYVVKLLEKERAMPYRKVGRERRVLLADALAYKERDDARRAAIVDELVREGQKLGLGY